MGDSLSHLDDLLPDVFFLYTLEPFSISSLQNTPP